MLKATLGTPSYKSHTGNTYLEEQYVLRMCNRDYRQFTGRSWDPNIPPEVDGCRTCEKSGKIAPLTTFVSTYGHCSEDKTRVFSIAHHDSMESWIESIDSCISRSLESGYAWDLSGTELVSVSSLSSLNEPSYEYASKCMRAQIKYNHSPLCVYTAQAYVECKERKGKLETTYPIPSQSTLMTGILGGINNNTTVEMGFEEPEGVRDMKKRAYMDDMIGFICCGHTAHSEDAGKSRRIASFTRVRVLSPGILNNTLGNAIVPKDGPWTVYCMGMTFCTDLFGVISITNRMNNSLRQYASSQFSYPNNQIIGAPPTYTIYYKEKVVCISVTPGAILRLLPDGSMVDSAMYHYQPQNPIVTHARIPKSGAESIKYKYSAFFMLCPYLEDDRPPRTLLASGQTVQAVCFPWAPATATVSPCHASSPIVSTQFMRNIEADYEVNEDAMWDILPGEDMLICYANLPLNYDDSMIVSSRFADYGGFQTMSVCTYRLFSNDAIPQIGEELCGKKYHWWKMPCTSHCVCTGYKRKSGGNDGCVKRTISSPRIPTGIVIDFEIADNGENRVEVLSFAQLLTGDKISTTHGQKGVVRIVPYEDLPVIVMPDGSTMVADLYMAVGSVTSRQTVGQIFESQHALNAIRQGKKKEVFQQSPMELEECNYLIDGITGKTIVSSLPNRKVVPVKASVGFARIFNQTQLTRERHHLTHGTEGKYSVGTSPGRAAGGGVATSEMDFHAMFSSGMLNCAQELLNRGNIVRVQICTVCKHVQVLCDCGVSNPTVSVRLSYDTVVFDVLSACSNGSANTYEVTHV